ncbi:hypothetical protein MesoLjLc_45760 [Mesorhizobium sp. L-8-10]|uniref:SGNH/GDSL hydrolase family protein n=1 Tax=Mesorhizobium sp. L-8-10 TaxID=2744523 RepID=UPI001928F415|nr:SGNH/GDSL hydrolase family protein [Mesorhizobium sp. L-8-10]BCH32646.1 hypothetical protein MesoLjLc_45760 [Mesorhizobium sp. L-8-10]
MGSIADQFNTAFRDFVTDGVPASGANEPKKSEIRPIGALIETELNEILEGMIAGVIWKEAVRVATTGAGTLASSFENGDAVDGVVLATGDRILIKNQASAAENGIYVVNASGAPTRADDANSGAELERAAVLVLTGSTNANTQWYCTATSITIGSTAVTWVNISNSNSALGTLQDAVESQYRAAFYRPICQETDRLLVPTFILQPPSGSAVTYTPPSSLAFGEFEWSDLAADGAWRLWINPTDQSMHAEVINASAPSGGNENLKRLATSYKGLVQEFDAPVARTLPNEYPFGKSRNDDSTKIANSVVAVDVTDAGLLALGFTRGWENAVNNKPLIHGDMLTPRRDGWLFVRVYVQSTVAGDFGTPYVFARNKAGTVVVAAPMLKEKSYNSDGSASYILWLELTGFECASLRVGPNATATGDIIICGLQFAWAQQKDIYVRRSDYPLPDEELGSRLRGLEQLAAPDAQANILYPDVMWAIDEWPVVLYPDTLTGRDNVGGDQIFTVATSKGAGRRPYVRQAAMMTEIEIDPARCGSTLQLRSVSLSKPAIQATKAVTLESAPLSALSGKSPTILMLGDSLFESSGTVPRLYEALVANGATPTFLGTIDGKDAYVGGITVRPCEGRGGKDLSHYTNADNTVMLVPASTAAYLALSSDDREGYNPFIRTAVGGETSGAPAYVRNGHVFDFQMYLDRFTYADPDFVFINSCANDIAFAKVGLPTSDAAANFIDGMLVLAKRIRADAPSAKIVFSLQATAFAGGVIHKWAEYVAVIQAAMDQLVTIADANTFILPVWAHQSRYLRWGTQSTISAATGSTPEIVRVTDDVHYRETGTDQAVETFLRFMANHV